MSAIKILLVDDDKSIRDLYEKCLGDVVFDKRFAADGAEALKVYEAWHPDVVVLDIIMPVMTGYSVLQDIRTVRKDKGTKIIMATSMTDTHDIRACVQFGIQGYIVKPFKLNEIANKIMHYIQQD